MGELWPRRRGSWILPKRRLWVLRAEWTRPAGGVVEGGMGSDRGVVGHVGRGWWLIANRAEGGGGSWLGTGLKGFGWLGA